MLNSLVAAVVGVVGLLWNAPSLAQENKITQLLTRGIQATLLRGGGQPQSMVPIATDVVDTRINRQLGNHHYTLVTDASAGTCYHQINIDFDTTRDGSSLQHGDAVNFFVEFEGVSMRATNNGEMKGLFEDAESMSDAHVISTKQTFLYGSRGNVLAILKDHSSLKIIDAKGGTLTMEFDVPSVVESVDIFKFAKYGSITMYDAEGKVLSQMHKPKNLSSGFQTIDLGTTENVKYMVFHMPNWYDGAIDDLKFRRPCPPCPQKVTFELNATYSYNSDGEQVPIADAVKFGLTRRHLFGDPFYYAMVFDDQTVSNDSSRITEGNFLQVHDVRDAVDPEAEFHSTWWKNSDAGEVIAESEFAKPSTIHNVIVMDTRLAGGTVELFDAGDSLIQEIIIPPGAQQSELRVVSVGGVRGVKRMKVSILGTYNGLDKLQPPFCIPFDPVSPRFLPAPSVCWESHTMTFDETDAGTALHHGDIISAEVFLEGANFQFGKYLNDRRPFGMIMDGTMDLSPGAKAVGFHNPLHGNILAVNKLAAKPGQVHFDTPVPDRGFVWITFDEPVVLTSVDFVNKDHFGGKMTCFNETGSIIHGSTLTASINDPTETLRFKFPYMGPVKVLRFFFKRTVGMDNLTFRRPCRT